MSAGHIESKVRQGALRALAPFPNLLEASIDQKHLSYPLIPHMLDDMLSTKLR